MNASPPTTLILKMNPPLRTEADRLAVIEGLLDGSLDIIATDHAPHTDYEKDCELDQAPFGIIGLETCLAICLEVSSKWKSSFPQGASMAYAQTCRNPKP